MTDYDVLFRELAVPRLVGTSNHRTVRETLKRELVARGFTVEEHAFSGRPSRAFFGTPRVVSGVNLVARRSDGRTAGRPVVWVCAHYDSKGQPISMAVRLIGFAALVVGLLTFLVAWIPAVLVLALALVIVSQNRINDNSPGALDNASALVAVFMVLDQLSGRTDIGVIFPDAEEFGLVGARALAAARADLFADSTLINLDGLDDTGRATAFVHRRGSLIGAVAKAVKARSWRWLPVIVDGIVLARVTRECVTIMKGGWRTMRVVHRPTDSADRLRLDGAASIAAGLARVLRGL